MMNKTQSARVHLTRFLFLLPLLVVVLLAFRNTNQERRQLQREKQLKTDTVPNTVKESSAWKDVENIHVTDNRKVTIRLKNGKVERYDMQVTKEREAFEAKYGSLPEPPAPPAPPVITEKERPEKPELPEKPEKLEAPEPDEKPEALEAPEKDEIPEAPEAPEPPKIFLSGPGKVVVHPRRADIPNAPEPPQAPDQPTINLQDCINKKGFCITVADNFGECIVIVKDKDNKIVQAIFLTDWNKDKQYEEKYGEIPPVQKKNTIRVVNGRPATLTNLKEVKEGTPKPDAVIVEQETTKPKIVLSAGGVAVPKPAGSIRAEPKEVVVLALKKEDKVQPLTVAKVNEVVVVGIKQEAKKAMSAKTAAEAKTRVNIKLDKPKEAEPAKPAPAQPKQEQ